MSELKFAFDEALRETTTFYNFAKKYLDPSADDCLKAFASTLSSIRTNAPLAGSPAEVLKRTSRWEIPDHSPLLTISSRSYEKGQRKGGIPIIGKITVVWEIIPDPKKNKFDVPKQFRLAGNGSVLAEWIHADEWKQVGKWNVDVADVKAPGCMFHVQFESGIPVPRVPSIAFTPLAVAEHMLGELFQDEWESHSRVQTTHMQDWASLQRQRLSTTLAWHQEVVAGSACPPWTALKTERMPANRFVSDE